MKNLSDFLNYLAKERKVRFSKSDTKEFLNAFVEYVEFCVENSYEFKIRGLGKLYYSKVPARTVKAYTDKFGVDHPEKNLPESRKVIFKLATNIRYSGQDFVPPEDLDKDSNM